MSAFASRHTSWGLALLFLGTAVALWRWQIPKDFTCAVSVTNPALGFTICLKHVNPKSDLNALDFSPNDFFRIPADERPPSGIAGSKPGEPCADSRCYAQTAMGWTQEHAACARGVRIGVISSAIDARHPALAGAAFVHNDVTSHQAGRTPHWHGTALLALLAGNSSGGVKGLVPEAIVSFADVFFADGQGAPAADVVSLLKVLNWMQVQNMHVLLLDMAGARNQLVDEAISSLVKSGAVVVMPAGPAGPAMSSHPDVITVAAVDEQMLASKDASRSSRIDLVAPGIDIWTALPDNKYGYASGNSFATAYVVAALAANYHSLPDAVPSQERRNQLLANLMVKDLGTGYGRGLALAPAGCVPGLLPVPALPSAWQMSPVHSR